MKIETERYGLYDYETGEVLPLVTATETDRWEKVFAKTLANMLDLIGEERIKVLAYMIKVKDKQNRVIETVRSLSEATGVSTKTVNNTLKTLSENNYIHRVRSGLIRFSPHVMVDGFKGHHMAVLRHWSEEERIENDV